MAWKHLRTITQQIHDNPSKSPALGVKILTGPEVCLYSRGSLVTSHRSGWQTTQSQVQTHCTSDVSDCAIHMSLEYLSLSHTCWVGGADLSNRQPPPPPAGSPWCRIQESVGWHGPQTLLVWVWASYAKYQHSPEVGLVAADWGYQNFTMLRNDVWTLQATDVNTSTEVGKRSDGSHFRTDR